MDKLLKTVAAFAAIALISVGAAGCHTVEGAGRDLQRTGEAVEDVFYDPPPDTRQP